MPSALQHDLKDEVVEVFTGDSLEDAMAQAVASLGPDLTVRRARRVRKGVQGLVGKDRYEVVAVPAVRVSDDVVDNAFEALLNQAEEAEEATLPEPAPRVRRVVRPSSTVTPLPDLEIVHAPAPAAIPAPRAEAPRAEAPLPRPKPKPRPAPQKRRPTRTSTTVAPGWSRKALADLGLPRRVLAHLPANDPRTDAAWITALTRAFTKELPTATPASPEHPVVVDGYGVEGVVGLLAAAHKGLPIGTITVGDRTAPATPTELALAVRAALVG